MPEIGQLKTSDGFGSTFHRYQDLNKYHLILCARGFTSIHPGLSFLYTTVTSTKERQGQGSNKALCQSLYVGDQTEFLKHSSKLSPNASFNNAEG